jgi:phospholipase C
VERHLTRRQLLSAGAATVAAGGIAALATQPWSSGGGGALAPLAPAPHPTPSHPLEPARLQDIDHFVIVLQENRSFDHYFGTFPGVLGFDDARRAGVIAQRGWHGGTLMPWHLATNGGPKCIADITHDWAPQHGSWNHGRMDRFVVEHLAVDGPKAGPETMGYFDHGDLAYYHELAAAFTICDRYHCSVLGPSDPNHLYVFSATLDPSGRRGGPMIETPAAGQLPVGRFTWTTMPEQLRERGISWKVYASSDREELENLLACFKQYRTNRQLTVPGLGTSYPADFLRDVRAGHLPQVSWVLGSLDESEHPSYSSAKSGELVTRQVVDEIMARPKLWRRTAILITWDENGGFFDHVRPPMPEPGTEGEELTVHPLPAAALGVRGPIGLGFRVPLLIVSPFARGGFVCSDVFDHTSLLRLLEARFGAEVPNLTRWRRSVTGDLTSAFNFERPDLSIPDLPVPGLSRAHLSESACEPPVEMAPPRNRLPQQRPGTPRRPSGIVKRKP